MIFLSLKNDVNAAMFQNRIRIRKSKDPDPHPDPHPYPYQNVTDPQHWWNDWYYCQNLLRYNTKLKMLILCQGSEAHVYSGWQQQEEETSRRDLGSGQYFVHFNIHDSWSLLTRTLYFLPILTDRHKSMVVLSDLLPYFSMCTVHSVQYTVHGKQHNQSTNEHLSNFSSMYVQTYMQTLTHFVYCQCKYELWSVKNQYLSRHHEKRRLKQVSGFDLTLHFRILHFALSKLKKSVPYTQWKISVAGGFRFFLRGSFDFL